MCIGRGSNQGPLGPKSDAPTTAPLRHLQCAYRETLMEIKGFSQCIAASKQQWCGIVAAFEFFICKLVLLLLVAATLRLINAATLQLLVAETLQLLVAATLQLLVAATLQLCRECVGLVVDCFDGWGMDLK